MNSKLGVEELGTEFKVYFKPKMIKHSFIQTCLLFLLLIMNLRAWST